MERTSKLNARNSFLGSPALGAVPPPLAPAAPSAEGVAPVTQAADRSTLSRRPLERLMEPGAPRLRQTAVTQAPSLKEAASNNDWLEWATTFG